MNNELPEELFERVDETEDGLFYDFPRLVTHVDDATIGALTAYLDDNMAEHPRVLDLMSSWISHLPSREYGEVVALGMNAEELAANPQAAEWIVHDLNRTPETPYRDARFDWVLISFSVQYLIKPQAVFSDIARVLAPGGTLLVAMSHRCFPTKAIRAFHVLPPAERVRFVGLCIDRCGRYFAPQFIDLSPENADPLWIVQATSLPGASQ